MSDNSSISVALCTFNGERYLQEQLDSIANQTRPPDELVICDDRSSDETLNLINGFKRTARFSIRVSVNDHTLGSVKNFEQAISLCRSDIIALSDQDDVWKPEKLKLIGAEFDQRPGVGLVFTDAEIVDKDLRSTGRRMWHEVGFREKEKDLIRKGRAIEVLLPGWSVTGATMAFRSKFRDLILPIPTNLPMIHDGWIALIIAAVAEVSFVEQPLIMYRQHEQQQIGAPGAQVEKQTKSVEHLRRAMKTVNFYANLISTAEHVRSRFAEHREMFECAAALRQIDARLGHLRMRKALPTSRLKRLRQVSRELLTGRYHRYSNGLYSAAKDLLT